MREVVNTLLRRDLGLVDEAMGPYFQDVYDHVLRATEWTESLRDLVSTILETNLTIQGNRTNSIMKKVTSWAAIIAVPTAVMVCKAVDEVMRQAEGAGGSVVKQAAATRWGYFGYFSDPDGHLWKVAAAA